MLEASDNSTDQEISHSLDVLTEINVSAQHVATIVDEMIIKVKSGDFSTDQGLSFLEIKYNMLLSYLINLTLLVLRKCSVEKSIGNPCVDRLVEIRTILEKIRPLDHKLKYQIDKLVKFTNHGNSSNDPMNLKAHPDKMMIDYSVESDEEEEDELKNEKNFKTKVYVPPKLSAVHYTGDDTALQRKKRLQEKSKRHAITSSIMQDLRDEYLDTPVEITLGTRAQNLLTKQQKEKQEYEEEYLTRLPVSKSEKHSRRQLTTVGTLGTEITDFGGSTKSGHKRRTKKIFKLKKKSFKKKRNYE